MARSFAGPPPLGADAESKQRMPENADGRGGTWPSPEIASFKMTFSCG